MASDRAALGTALQRQLSRMRALAAVSEAFAAATQDYDALVRTVVERIATETGDACTLRLLSTDGQVLEPVACHHTDPALARATRAMMRRTVPLSETGGWREVIEERRLMRQRPQQGDAGREGTPEQLAFLAAHPIASLLLVPLVARGAILGGIALVRYGTDAAPHDDEDEVFLRDLASAAALAIDNARLIAAAQASEERLAALSAELEERVRARTAELERSQQRFRVLFEQAMDAILVTSTDGRIHAANPAAERLYGRTEAELIAAGTAAVVDYADPRVAALVEERRRTGSARSEVTARRGDGNTFPAEVASSQFPTAGGVEHVGTIIRDLTDQKRLEAEREELARAKDELVAVVSHELRTPLSSLVGFAELLLAREFPEEERREFLGIILQEGQRLTALINDFLDVERLESGRQRLSPEPTPVRVLVDRAVAAAGEDPAHPFVVEVPADLPPVLADPDRIHQVLTNLVSNARKYAPGGGAVTIAASVVDDAVELSVADEGLGIPAEALPKLFEKFYRVDSSDRREIGGTGLGLAIVKGLVEAHGGRVEVRSEGPGRGSTFAFTLPVSAAAPVAAEEVGAPDRAARHPGAAGGDVLVVEDDAAYAAWLARTLRLEGYPVRLASTAEVALRAVDDVRPGVVLLDLRLGGGMDGWELLAVLRGRPETHDLPVVVVSAQDEQARGQALDVLDYLMKPAATGHLVAVLARAGVDRRRPVLVVDDDPAARRLVEEALALEGVRCVCVGSGEEALAALEAEPERYGLIVLDIGLPGIDGLTVLDRIRDRPALRGVPVVVFTGRDLSDEEKDRLHQQAQQIVGKGNGVPIGDAVARHLGPAARGDAPGRHD